MNQNLGNCIIVKFAPQTEIAENLEDFAAEFFEVIEINYTADNQEQLCGYMRTDTDETAMQQAAEAWQITLPAYKIETLRGRDWLSENVIKFAPVETEDFLIYGIHEQSISTRNKIGIKIYAATAFGSEHQTTVSCLQAISDINKTGMAVQKILDVGTGSGILSIAAAKLWPQAQIVAVDIDEESLKVTKQNAADNNTDSQITVCYSDGYSAPLVSANAPYDIILANILARPLIAMAQDMAQSLRIGGYAVISGFIAEQVDWVLAEHAKFGLQPQKIYERDNWRAALLKRIG